MAEDFSRAVEEGLKLSKRVYYGKDHTVAPPKPPASMDKFGYRSHLPMAPMVYAVIFDPAIVDNPDMPSYQPHVHGRCDPPALIPLHMSGIEVEVDCFLDTAVVRVSGSWRVHCVMGSRSCDCRIAIPMGEQGSILGVEVDVSRRLYSTQLAVMEDKNNTEKTARAEDGGFLKPHIFVLTIPKVDGGTNLSIKVSWSQKLLYSDGQFSLNVSFNFPGYVTPVGKQISKKEKIQLNVIAGPEVEVLCKTISHPLKEVRRGVGKLGFLYEAEVLTWSNTDLKFSFDVSSSHISGSVLLQSPSVHDIDQREMFYAYLFPGYQQSRKVFQKNVIFIVDISGSMRGKPLEDTKNSLSVALFMLDPKDSFNIIAFNGVTYLFSTSMEFATKDAVERATEWIGNNFIAGGGTNILLSLNKAMEMLSITHNLIPIIFLITDGAVEDERHICDVMKSHLTNRGSICPRIYTFGIGNGFFCILLQSLGGVVHYCIFQNILELQDCTFCNHYFLRMLAMIGRGHHDAAYDVDSVEDRMQRFFTRASSSVLANIDLFDDLDDVEVYPSRIPDLSSASLLTISGRYKGKFPDTIKAKGILADLNSLVVDLKVQQAKGIPLDRIFAKQQIDLLTAQAWFSEDKQLEAKVAKMSVQTGVVSEYTRVTLVETDGGKTATELAGEPEGSNKSSRKTDPESQKTILLQSLGIGFGNLTATAENIPPGSEESQLAEVAEILVNAASNCCGRMCGYCCCMCCIQVCSRINNQCAIALTQCISALACFGCFSCCELCFSGHGRSQ